MTKMTVYPSGKTAAEENKQPQTVDLEMETHACGQNKEEGLFDPFSNKALAAGMIIGAGAMYVGDFVNNASVNIGNQAFAERDEIGYATGYAGAIGGAFVEGAGLVVFLTSTAVLANRVKKAYQNSSAKQKIDPVMREVGAFLNKNAQRAINRVRQSKAFNIIRNLRDNVSR